MGGGPRGDESLPRTRGHDVHLHNLRHSFASRVLALGEGLTVIGKLLGHARIETTSHYAHLARFGARIRRTGRREYRRRLAVGRRAPPSSRAAGTATGAQEGSGEGRSTATAARSLCAPGAGSRGCDGTPPPAPARSRPGRSPSPGCSGTAPSRPRSPRASSHLKSARAGA